MGNYRQSNGRYSSNSNGYDNGYAVQNGRDVAPRQQRKHSGARKGIDKKGGSYISGWNYSRKLGLVKFFAVATKFSKEVISKSGRVYTSVMVLVDIPFRPQLKLKGFVEVSTGKCRIPSAGMVINPMAPNGGYCGKSQKPKQQQNRY